jgi:U4/U6.U5 tri-snRNP-associated protein 3
MQIDSKTNGRNGVDEDDDSEDALLKRMMGFSTFKSTANTKIPGNNVSGVRKEKSTNYRQYMNRTGGFNRPLSPSRD